MAPDRVSRFVGISPVPASGVQFDGPTADLFQRAVTTAEVRRQIIDSGTSSRYHHMWLDKMVKYSLAHSTPEAFAGYLESWSGGDFHTEVVGADVPVKVIVGAHDPDLTAEVMRSTSLQWFPNAELRLVTLKDAVRDHRAYVARAGFVVASLEYRALSHGPGVTYADGIQDLKGALRFLRAHAARFGIDPARAGVWGESAGVTSRQ